MSKSVFTAIIVTYLSTAIAFAARPRLTEDEARQFMASRDLQLNNVVIEYTKTGSEFLDVSDMDFSGMPPENFVSEVPFSHRERMVIRAHEFTTFSDAIADFKGELSTGQRLTPHTRWTNRGGHVIEVLGQDGGAKSIVTHLPEAHSFGGSNRFLWPIEFTLGVGFGRRTDSLKFQSQDHDSITGNCTLSLSADEKAQCEFTMDSDYIVRAGTIRTGNDKRWYEYKVTTTGLLKAGDYQCAQSGEFAASIFTREEDGTVLESRSRKYSVTDVSIKNNLSDSDYEALTRFELPENRQVEDPHGVLAKPAPEVDIRWTVIVCNLLLISIVCFLLLRRQLAKQKQHAN